MKYKPLESPCKECQLKCFRVEDPNFTKDNNCRYKDNPIKEFKEILGIQEKIKM